MRPISNARKKIRVHQMDTNNLYEKKINIKHGFRSRAARGERAV